MSPEFWTRVAARLYPVRWWLMAGSVSTFALLAWTAWWRFAADPRIWFLLSGPVTFVPWALFCACLWFHPTRGTMRESAGWLHWFPPQIAHAIRWNAALFLGVFSLLAGAGMPLFAMLA